VFGDIFPAQGDGNDVIVYEPAERRKRQAPNCCASLSRASAKAAGLPSQISSLRNRSGKMDVIGLSLVTIGAKASSKRSACLRVENTRSIFICTD
jgi:cobalamin-dependent methionine synthase I